jgi:hypothetical protein
MTRIVSALRAALDRSTHRPPAVHFHAYSGEAAEVCHDAHCARPRL